MKNKYQEAIDELRTGLGLIAYLFGSKDNTEPLKSSKQLDALQELVDEKVTPIEPTIECSFIGPVVYKCGKCGEQLFESWAFERPLKLPRYCSDCGTEIDWSEDE